MLMTVAHHPRVVRVSLHPRDVSVEPGGVVLSGVGSGRSGAPFPLPEPLSLVPSGAVTFGHVADAVVSADEVELRRRRAHGLVSLTSLTSLDALLSLPLGVSVRVADLSARVARVVRRAPAGVVDVADGLVVRRLRVPLTVHGVLVREQRWDVAVRSARSFGPFSQRVIVAGAVPTSLQLWDAQMYGIGVWVTTGSTRSGPDDVTVVLPPAPFRASQFKAVGWQFAERALTRLVGLSAGDDGGA